MRGAQLGSEKYCGAEFIEFAFIEPLSHELARLHSPLSGRKELRLLTPEFSPQNVFARKSCTKEVAVGTSPQVLQANELSPEKKRKSKSSFERQNLKQMSRSHNIVTYSIISVCFLLFFPSCIQLVKTKAT